MKRFNFWCVVTLSIIIGVNIIGQFAFPYCAWMIGSNPVTIVCILIFLFFIGICASLLNSLLQKKWNSIGGVLIIIFISLNIYGFRIGEFYRPSSEYQGDYIWVKNHRYDIGLADKWGRVVIPCEYVCLCTVMSEEYNEEMILGIKHLSNGQSDGNYYYNYECHLYSGNKLCNVGDAIKWCKDPGHEFDDVMHLETYIVENYGKIIKVYGPYKKIKNVVLFEPL